METMIRGSSLPRFMTCNGSATFVNEPQEDSEQAREGTAFHELLEAKFKGHPFAAAATNMYFFDQDMFYFADKILPMIPENAEAEVEVEYKASNTTIKGHVDYNWEEDGGDTLVVMDIKYGHRVVEVENNWQLIGYALGIMIAKQRSYSKIVMRIIQPRAHHSLGWTRDVSMTNEQALEYYNQLTVAMQNYEAGKFVFQTSDKCRYCAGVGGKCTAFNQAFYNAVDVVKYEPFEDNLTNDQLQYMLGLYDRVKDIFKIKEESLIELAKGRINKGEHIKGYSTEPALGNRKWTANVDPATIKLMTGVDLEKKVMMSPADAEKANIDEEVIKTLTYREQKGFKLIKIDANKQAEQIFGKGV